MNTRDKTAELFMYDCKALLAQILPCTRSNSRGDFGEEADSSHPLDKPAYHTRLAARQLSGLLAWKLWVVLWAVGVSAPTEAAPGDLDPSLDLDGRLVIDVFGAADAVSAVVVQPDSKLVVAGRVENTAGNLDFGLVRLNPDGSPDTTFDFDGLELTAFGDGDDTVRALVIQPDGKLVAAGSSSGANGDSDFALARYNPDGSLDTSFGTNGRVLTGFRAGSDDHAHALVLQTNGKLVAAGDSDADGSRDFALVRYNPDGGRDPTFGEGDGRVLTDLCNNIGCAVGQGSEDRTRALVLQPNGKLVAAGFANAEGSDDFALVRYNPDGSLDLAFRPGFFGGRVLTDLGLGLGTLDRAHALVLQPNGKLVAAGFSDAGGSLDFALVCYHPDGSLDTSFDGDGLMLTDFSGSADVASALVVLPNSKLVAAGLSDASDFKFDFALARYHPNGSLDTSFGINGRVLTDFSGAGSPDSARALALQPDGKLVAAGLSGSELISDFALARYAGEPVLCNGLVATQLGTSTNDILVGTAGDDVIHGHGGASAGDTAASTCETIINVP